MDIQLNNSRTHSLWQEGKTVSRDGHLTQGTIKRLTLCGKKAGQSAEMDVDHTMSEI
jgi:hypothetical protein